MKRSEVFDEFERAGVRVDDGVAFRTDDAVERLQRFWILRGSKRGVTIGIDTDERGEEVMIWIEDRNPASTPGDFLAGLKEPQP